MSTDIDGPVPSMADDTSDSEPGSRPVADGAAAPRPDVTSVKMRRELRKRAMQRIRTAGGRHTRTDVASRALPENYVPRHALSTPGPAAVSPAAVVVDPAPAPEEDFYTPPPPKPEVSARKRERVVLAERRRPVRPVRTEVDVRELTGVGDMLSTNLIRSQLGLALRVGSIALFTLVLLPALFAVFPVLGRIEVLHIRLPWLLLGALAYPFLLGLGWLHARAAERLEQSFTEHVRD